MSNLHDGHRDRMRNRFLQEGPDGFADHEILEMLLYGTIPRGDTNVIAHQLLREFGSFSNLLEAVPQEIVNSAGVGLKTAVNLSLLHEVFRRYQREKLRQKPALTSVARVAEYCHALLANCPTERFYMVCLDSRRNVVHTVKMTEGTVSEASLSPRTVVEVALRYQSTGVVFCHNHPRGCIRPSFEDIRLTTDLKRILLPLGVQVVDHIIVGDNRFYSFYENDMLREQQKEE